MTSSYPPDGHSGAAAYVALRENGTTPEHELEGGPGPIQLNGDDEELSLYAAPSVADGGLRKQLLALRKKRFFKPIFVFLVILLLLFIINLTSRIPSINKLLPDLSPPVLAPEAFAFKATTKPYYLSRGLDKPVVIRLGIIARVDAFERRQALREAMLSGVPAQDVKLDYRFFVGQPKEKGAKRLRIKLELAKEQREYGDVIVLDQEDITERISEKRFHAIQWVSFFFFASHFLYFLLFDFFKRDINFFSWEIRQTQFRTLSMIIQ